MNFLLILAAALVEFTVTSFAGMRSRQWSRDWADWTQRTFGRYAWWNGAWGAAVLLAVPVGLVALAFALLGEVSDFLYYAAALFVLLLMLGPDDLNAEIEAFKRQILIAGSAEPPDGDSFLAFGEGLDLGEPTGDAAYDAQRAELSAVVLAADAAWYQPLFWFFVLGPVGAVLYRLCANLRGTDAAADGALAAVAALREVMEWLPGRLTVFAMGVAGTLVPVVDAARAHGVMRWSVTESLLGRAALAAIDQGRVQNVVSTDPRIYRLNLVHALARRTLNVWFVFLAIGALLT